MQHILRHPVDLPDWQAASARRLGFSMLVATVIVSLLLSVIRMPEVKVLPQLAELMVDIVRHEAPVATVPPLPQLQEEPAPQTDRGIAEPQAASASRDDVLPPAVLPQVETGAAPDQATIEWEEEKAAAVLAAIDALENTVSVNPGFDERRREAATRFRPSALPEDREIWDNVEKDQLGRTILRSGNCFRVIDDPSVANSWAFDNFDQYITYCSYRKYIGKELPWVEDVRDRHQYLREIEQRRNGIFPWDQPDPE